MRNDEVPKFLKGATIMSCLMHENIAGFEAVCYHHLMFMMELVVFDFNVFGTDNKLTTLEDLLCYCDSFTVMASCNLRNLFLEVGKLAQIYHF